MNNGVAGKQDFVRNTVADKQLFAFVQKVKIAWVVFLRGIRGRKTPMEKLLHRYKLVV